jgi:hypothetical protein
MRMLLKSALPATFVLPGLGIATGLPGQFRPNNESVQFVPFVSHEREVAFSAEGAITEIQDRSYARRRDGSSYSKFTFTWVNGASEAGDSGLVVIWDLARHAVIAIDGTTQSVTTTYLSPARVSSLLGEEHACANVERRNLVTSTIGSILGYNVSEEAVSASDENWRRWDAKNLDCYPLKEKTEFLDAVADGSRTACWTCGRAIRQRPFLKYPPITPSAPPSKSRLPIEQSFTATNITGPTSLRS